MLESGHLSGADDLELFLRHLDADVAPCTIAYQGFRMRNRIRHGEIHILNDEIPHRDVHDHVDHVRKDHPSHCVVVPFSYGQQF